MRALFLAFLLPLSLALAACQTPPANPVATAERFDQKAYAVAGLFTIVKEEGLDLAVQPTTPVSVVKAIRDGNRIASPLVRAMMIAAREYTAITNEIERVRLGGGTPTQEKVAAATTAFVRLEKTYSDAKIEVDKFVAIVNRAKGV